MSVRLTQVDIEYFRGATNPCSIQFDETKPLVVVFGENGTGKSTLVDAFDLVANIEIGTIRDRASATNKHAPAIGKKPKDIKVTLHRNNSKWNGSMKGASIKVAPIDGRPCIEILRRKQLLAFIEAVPGERYKILQRFIDVRGVEQSERAALEALNEAKQENEDAIGKILSAETALSELWEANGRPNGEWRKWAAGKRELSTEELDVEIDGIKTILSATQAFESKYADYKSADRSSQEVKEKVQELEEELNSQESNWSTQTSSLIETLEATSELLDAGWSKNKCPVCSQAIQPSELRERVSNSLATLNNAKSAYDRHQSAIRTVKRAEEQLETDKTQLIRPALALVEACISHKRQEVEALSLPLLEIQTTLQQESVAQQDFLRAISQCEQIAKLASDMTSIRDELSRDSNQLHTIQTEFGNLEEAENDSKETDKLAKRLEQIHTIVRDKRIDFVQEVLDSVAGEVSRLYAVIHPEEDTKAGGLRLDPKKRASLNQFAEFAGEADVEPQGYFSDSHLDTLGFCYWLALAKREQPKSKVIVLDDVFTSVDAPHLMRIVELIDNECESFAQLFVITHNRNWRNQYAFNRAAGGKAHLVELRKWNPVRGITHDKTELEVDKLQTLLDQAKRATTAVARQEICNRAGVLLEAIFDQLSSQYRCSIPRSADGNYALADLMNSCTKLMKKLTVRYAEENDDTEVEPLPVQNEFNAVKETAFIRNLVGCHYNEAGAELTDVQVEEFGNCAVLLAKVVSCPKCGEIPRSNKSTHRQCSCKHTQLIPATV